MVPPSRVRPRPTREDQLCLYESFVDPGGGTPQFCCAQGNISYVLGFEETMF